MNCRIVLVRPQIAANLGATARVMRNMGVGDLVLVDPVADPTDRRALQLSTQGETILRHCRRVAELSEALADCVLVAATSANVGGLFRAQSADTAEALMPRLVEAMTAGPVALVFGPEPTGLRNDEVTSCHYLIHIPTDPVYPTLNLAQSVAICLYELRRVWLRQQPEKPSAVRASYAEQERMFAHLRQALERIHFLYGAKAETLLHALRHLIGRAQPTPMEVKVLHGLARQILWFADHSDDS